jgi:pimeloyl-ACP methyl ester carboxylesterase
MTLVVVVPLILILAIYFVIGGVVAHNMVKPDRKPITETPSESGFGAVESVSFRTEDGVPLKGYLLGESAERAILVVHGVFSHSWDGQTPDLARVFVDAGFRVLVFDFRCHGRSGGDHLGLGWLERLDVAAAIRFLLLQGFTPGKIGIHAVSYGASASIFATATIPDVDSSVGALVLDSSFANINDVVEGEIQRQTSLPSIATHALMPGIRFMAGQMYSLDLSGPTPYQTLTEIHPRPTLLIHGEDDPVTPVKNAMRLKAAAPYAELWILPGRLHTEGVRLAPDGIEPSPTREEYLKKVTNFFDRAL